MKVKNFWGKAAFREKYAARIGEIKNGQRDFLFEMRRFLMPSAFSNQFTSEMWWEYLLELLKRQIAEYKHFIAW